MPLDPSGSPRLRPAARPLHLPMPSITPGQVAFSVIRFLPVPVLVLDGEKTAVLANEAMGKLLGLMPATVQDVDSMVLVMDQLRGRSLSQIGVDLVQEAVPVWVDWHDFLDQAAAEAGLSTADHDKAKEPLPNGGGATPSLNFNNARRKPPSDIAVEVLVSCGDASRKSMLDSAPGSDRAASQTRAQMIVSPWHAEDNQILFTLTFMDSGSPAISPPRRSASVASLPDLAGKNATTTPRIPIPPGDTSPSSRRSRTPAVSLSSSPAPYLGPPLVPLTPRSPSVLQKITLMKDALLDKTQTPILAMWKDGSVTFPNRAARSLFSRNTDADKMGDGFDLLPSSVVWSEDFSRQLDPSEHPMSVLIRTETPFACRRIGMHDVTGQQLVFDVEGATLRDEITGEFIAGITTYRDVTKMTEEIIQLKAGDEGRFRLICDTMPQLIWTATPDGTHDFFNSRWHSYTGLSKEESRGWGWQKAFHPEDLPETERRWKHSLGTGEPYSTEYRCRSKDGEWRWFLGRALPLKNNQTGIIEKWFGTCTDIHENIKTQIEAERTREQLLSVIALSNMTIFNIDRNRKVTMLEGALIWNSHCDSNEARWYIGENVYKVFNRLNPQLPEGTMPPFLELLESILSGTAERSHQEQQEEEHEMDGRWYRTRFQPILSKETRDEGAKPPVIEGVVGFIMDVTELKTRERDLETQVQEKRQLVANEAAANEASRLKSQFLANMSHEIRTPISGVIGMTELLLDAGLGQEQQELAENIHRSANALLTVINDILDISKVESGRLDIEEVQFSLPVVVRDVSKMLNPAAERKRLTFRTVIATDVESDLGVMGDPGRVRQIMTNLLANSIKFTSQGSVLLSVSKEKENADIIEVKFSVQDTGIGIGEEVQRRLFQPFYQGDASTGRKYGGTGLGLSISKTLVKLMKGRIELESTLGVGTTVTFWIPFKKPQWRQSAAPDQADPLPNRPQLGKSLSYNTAENIVGTALRDEPRASLEDRAQPASRASSNSSLVAIPKPEEELLPLAERANIHVLVVEDNPINQQFALRTIKKLGFQVAAVWNGKEALDYLAAAMEGKQTKPDIILMDVQMPVIDGYKCTRRLRHHLSYKAYVSDVPIVAMTASAIQGDQEKCRRAGMDDYLAKPVKIKTLEHMLVRWSTRRRRARSADDRDGNRKASLGPVVFSDDSDSGEHHPQMELFPTMDRSSTSRRKTEKSNRTLPFSPLHLVS
ncbi:putative signal transduction histidine-protein kinase [Achaetomium macrosporum]|uniref:histidine kinase n=1 Tax=Achaetomium macrosporum TaxID=79813 RepID=A0AAN7C9M7_9PEZI|nr:putative signal transduction histidine-protein kinase [Achaetomium macrosporum]